MEKRLRDSTVILIMIALVAVVACGAMARVWWPRPRPTIVLPQLNIPRLNYLPRLSPASLGLPAAVIEDVAGGQTRALFMMYPSGWISLRLDGTGQQRTAHGPLCDSPETGRVSLITAADGIWLACISSPQAASGKYQTDVVLTHVSADGTFGESHTLLSDVENPFFSLSWSPDGHYLAIVHFHHQLTAAHWMLEIYDAGTRDALTLVRSYSPEPLQPRLDSLGERHDLTQLKPAWSDGGKTLRLLMGTISGNGLLAERLPGEPFPAGTGDLSALSPVPMSPDTMTERDSYGCALTVWRPQSSSFECIDGSSARLIDADTMWGSAWFDVHSDLGLDLGLLAMTWFSTGTQAIFLVGRADPCGYYCPVYTNALYLYTPPST